MFLRYQEFLFNNSFEVHQGNNTLGSTLKSLFRGSSSLERLARGWGERVVERRKRTYREDLRIVPHKAKVIISLK